MFATSGRYEGVGVERLDDQQERPHADAGEGEIVQHIAGAAPNLHAPRNATEWVIGEQPIPATEQREARQRKQPNAHQQDSVAHADQENGGQPNQCC